MTLSNNVTASTGNEESDSASSPISTTPLAAQPACTEIEVSAIESSPSPTTPPPSPTDRHYIDEAFSPYYNENDYDYDYESAYSDDDNSSTQPPSRSPSNTTQKPPSHSSPPLSPSPSPPHLPPPHTPTSHQHNARLTPSTSTRLAHLLATHPGSHTTQRHYKTWRLARGRELLHFPMPDKAWEVEVLSLGMAVWIEEVFGGGVEGVPPVSPYAHRWHPFWVGGE
ncbi:hypothetical protein EKO04_004247 [Ascochyta lentis]|uniref:Uncharacterized protein n=1 Tax=Ascochyta lentis TaxID=205686 RepID=A0A8H7J707_9PLEO|nr:hypothetical protein EKO04_004247 [Ascochyta lentis]